MQCESRIPKTTLCSYVASRQKLSKSFEHGMREERRRKKKKEKEKKRQEDAKSKEKEENPFLYARVFFV